MFGTVGDRGYLEAGELRIFAFFVLTGIDNRRTVDNRDVGGDNTDIQVDNADARVDNADA